VVKVGFEKVVFEIGIPYIDNCSCGFYKWVAKFAIKIIFFNWYIGGWSSIGSTWHCGH
jgi:hypothetical protein